MSLFTIVASLFVRDADPMSISAKVDRSVESYHERERQKLYHANEPAISYLALQYTKIANAHAAELEKLSISDPDLEKKIEELDKNNERLKAITLQQANLRFGEKMVSSALWYLGYDD